MVFPSSHGISPRPPPVFHHTPLYTQVFGRVEREGLVTCCLSLASRPIHAIYTLQVVFPSAHGILLPALGLQLNQLSLKISTDASNGPVQGFSVSTSQVCYQTWGDNRSVSSDLISLPADNDTDNTTLLVH